MTRPAGESCANCMFGDNGDVTTIDMVADGPITARKRGLACKRFPPTPMYLDGTIRRIQLTMRPDDWCGEWRPQL